MANPNKIRIENDIIVIVLHGKQTFDIADKTYKSVRTRIQKLKLQKKPVHILANITDIQGHDSAARTRIKEFFKLDYDKLAYFGARPYGHNLVLYLAGPHYHRVRQFKNKELAIKWLTDGKEPLFSMKEPTPASSRLLLLLTCLLGIIITLIVFAKLYQGSISLSERQAAHAASDAADASIAKINAYLNTLYGFRSFFAASDTMDQKKFHLYYTQLDLASRFPGITAIAYIREVPDTDKQAIVDEIRSDTSLPNTALANFEIKNPNQQSIYFPVVYIEPLPATPDGFGRDISAYPDRLQSMQKANQTNMPVVSGSLKMINNGKTSNDKGFIMTIPVSGNGSIASHGYINAIFNYDELFAKTTLLTNDAFEIADYTQNVIYKSDKVLPATSVVAKSDIPIADKTWHLYLYGNTNYGLSNFERLTPWVVLVTGLGITALVAFGLNNLLRSRQSAFELAHYITEDLRVAEHKHDMMIESVKDYAIYMLDKDGKVMTWNSGAALIKGYKAGEILGKHFSVFYRKGERRAATRMLKQAATDGRAEVYGWRVRKDKTEFWAHVIVSAIHDESGELLGFTKLTQDLTKQRQLEQERDNFVAIATHELKTPITSIKAYAQSLQSRFIKSGDLRSAELLGRMDSQANKLTMLVSDLLDVSKIETGHLTYDKKPFDFDMLVATLAEEIGRTSSRHSISISGKIGKPIVGDEYRIGQIVTNLIENAIKYSPGAKRVIITMRKHGENAELRVRDFGPGISPADQARIFEQFYRTEGGDQISGFGLGLFISSEIAKNHGGQLTVKSRPGQGSTFTLHLPLDSTETKMSRAS
jgi:PAS domain S-box-containing protein